MKEFSKSNPLLHFCIEKHFDFCFVVLKDFPFYIGTVFNDFRKTELPDFFDTVTNLLSRQIGVVLQHQRKKPGGIHFEIVTKKCHKDSYGQHYITPEYPVAEVPPLIELLDQIKHPEHDNARFKFLKWIINDEKLQDLDLRTIPKNYFLDVLVLTFLVRKGESLIHKNI